METVFLDYAPRGVDFYYVYKPLAHPEFTGYVNPFTLEERIMHVHEAERRLGSGVTWLADTMENHFHNAMAKTPNSELIVDADGIIVSSRAWSDPEALRADLEQLVGPVEHPTTVADLDLPALPPPPTVARGVVPRVERTLDMLQLQYDPIIENETPFYVKLRAEGDKGLYQNGTGTLYIGMHLDPLYRVHWNNEAGPVRFTVTAPDGVTVTPSSGVGPTPEALADADPREFLLQVDGAYQDELTLDVFYFACDDELTFCIPVNQKYVVSLERDMSHSWSIPTDGQQAESMLEQMRSRAGR